MLQTILEILKENIFEIIVGIGAAYSIITGKSKSTEEKLTKSIKKLNKKGEKLIIKAEKVKSKKEKFEERLKKENA